MFKGIHLIDFELLIDNLCASGFHISDDFLAPNHYQSLRKQALHLEQQGSFKSAKIGLNLQAQHNDAIRTDKIFWLDEAAPEHSIHMYLEQANQLAQQCNEALFLSLCEFETHFAIYPPGSFYKKHVDQFLTTKSRKISCVYYLNEDWQEEYGGQLKLYNKEDELIQSIIPKGNRFICFNSELPHEVCTTHQTRYSIAGWMKTR